MSQHRRAQRNETWADIKQFGYGLLLILPFLAVFAYGARVLIGGRAAVWVAVGIAAVGVVAYGSVILACLVVSYGHDMTLALARMFRRVRANRRLKLPPPSAASK